MQSPEQAQADLIWFFQQSCADCGVSSSQGHLLDVAKSGVWSHSGNQHVLLESERVMAAVTRRRQIQSRLSRITGAQFITLGLAFSTPDKIGGDGGISFPLAAETEAAKTSHAQMRLKPAKSVEGVVDHTGLKFRKLYRYDGLNGCAYIHALIIMSKQDQGRSKTPRDTTIAKASKKTLDTIVAEGRLQQAEALEAYLTTWVPRVRVKSSFRRDVDSMGLPAALAKSRREEVI